MYKYSYLSILCAYAFISIHIYPYIFICLYEYATHAHVCVLVLGVSPRTEIYILNFSWSLSTNILPHSPLDIFFLLILQLSSRQHLHVLNPHVLKTTNVAFKQQMCFKKFSNEHTVNPTSTIHSHSQAEALQVSFHSAEPCPDTGFWKGLWPVTSLVLPSLRKLDLTHSWKTLPAYGAQARAQGTHNTP